MSVDLPAPFSPTTAWTSPASTRRETSRLATTPGKRFVMPVSSTTGTTAGSGTRTSREGTRAGSAGADGQQSPVRAATGPGACLGPVAGSAEVHQGVVGTVIAPLLIWPASASSCGLTSSTKPPDVA